MGSIDLNSDLGEEASPSGDEAILDIVTSASIACGFHAGDPATMHRTVSEAQSRGVTVGAHPSYADRDGFGREELALPLDRIADDVLYQVGALDAIARALGTQVKFVKPHGALYNRMAVDVKCAQAICEATRAYGGLILLAPAGSVAIEVAGRLHVDVAAEVFADRAYLPDGRLAPRTTPGALITDPTETARRAVSLVCDRRITSLGGGTLELAGSSICVHGDTPRAVESARAVACALEDAGISVAPFVS